MECSEMCKKLSCYIDGELDEQARRQVEAHLAECAECRQELSELRLLAAAVGDSCEMEPPAALRQAIAAAAESAEAQSGHSAEMETLLSAFVDSELSSEDLVQVTHHLAVCDDCRVHLSDIRASAQAAHQIDLIETPTALRSSISAAVASMQTKRDQVSIRDWFKRIAPAGTARWAAGAAVAGVVVLGVMIGTPNGLRHSQQASLKHQKPVPIASKLDSSQAKQNAEESALETRNSAEMVATASIPEAHRRHIVLKASREVTMAVNRKPAVHHASLPKTKPEIIAVKAKPSHVKPALPVAKEPAPEPVEVASVDQPATPSTETVNAVVVKPTQVDVAKVTAEEQESIRQWLREAKARAATKKNNQNSGITLLSKEF